MRPLSPESSRLRSRREFTARCVFEKNYRLQDIQLSKSCPPAPLTRLRRDGTPRCAAKLLDKRLRACLAVARSRITRAKGWWRIPGSNR